MHQSDPSQGELSFELLAEIAVGATARIELCRVVDGRMRGELVAVKRLHPHIADDPQFVDMFRDEVWMTAALKHQHVVEVVGWGQDARGPWLAVEFVRGVSLQRLMKTVFETGERFTERMIVYLARSISDGLAEAHALRSAEGVHLNLVHRDLTPGNVLLGFDGQVKIADFGLAKAKQRLTNTLTGLLKGQPQYMSPEQVQNTPLDGRSDVFALGVMLFELFTGRRPWNASTDLDAMRAITSEEPADLHSLRPKIDRALVDVVHRCLEKAPEKRFQSALELRDRFQQWLDAHGYRSENHLTLARFVRRNAMRQMRWFERATAGEFADEARAQHAQQVLSQPVRPVTGAGPASPAALNEESTRDERPSARRAVPNPRAEAKTRTIANGKGLDDAKTLENDDEDIDWGEDGPTLVHKSKEAREMIQRARKKAGVEGVARASRRQRLPSVAEHTTKRRRLRRPIPQVYDDTIEDEDSSEIATRVGKKAEVAAALAEHAVTLEEEDPDADATVQLDAAGAKARELLQKEGALGTLAPPDPDVPPLPPGSEQELASQVPPKRRAPPARPGPPQVTDTAATRPLSLEEGERISQVPSLRSRPSRPVAHTVPISPADIELEMDPVIGALPAPRFPSDPSFTGEVLSTDFGAEALRLSNLAKQAAEDAKQAAELAAAAKRAAALSGEASMLAATGKQHRALVQLREAQTLAEKVRRGEVPEGEWDTSFVEIEVPPFRQDYLGVLASRLRTREGVMMAALALAALVLLLLLLIVIIW